MKIDLITEKSLEHIAIIMDGNARWAKENGKLKSFGHKQGAEAAKNIIRHAASLKLPYITLYTFSSENWQRPKDEVSIIMELLQYYVEREIEMINNYGIRVKIIGNLERLDKKLRLNIENAIKKTENNTTTTLCLAFSYGSRQEIIDACQKLINSVDKEVTEESFRANLYDPQMPDVDLLIRTSGSHRISNFLLWQSAYAELLFVDKYWPDFLSEDLDKAIKEFSTRERSFGRRI